VRINYQKLYTKQKYNVKKQQSRSQEPVQSVPQLKVNAMVFSIKEIMIAVIALILGISAISIAVHIRRAKAHNFCESCQQQCPQN
jgi:hypothetical protein